MRSKFCGLNAAVLAAAKSVVDHCGAHGADAGDADRGPAIMMSKFTDPTPRSWNLVAARCMEFMVLMHVMWMANQLT